MSPGIFVPPQVGVFFVSFSDVAKGRRVSVRAPLDDHLRALPAPLLTRPALPISRLASVFVFLLNPIFCIADSQIWKT